MECHKTSFTDQFFVFVFHSKNEALVEYLRLDVLDSSHQDFTVINIMIFVLNKNLTPMTI